MKIGKNDATGRVSQTSQAKKGSAITGSSFHDIFAQQAHADAGVQTKESVSSATQSKTHSDTRRLDESSGCDAQKQLVQEALDSLSALEKDLRSAGAVNVSDTLKTLDKIMVEAASSAIADAELRAVIAVERERIRKLGMIQTNH